MQHKYSTHAIVLARYPAREGGLSVALLTHELGLVHARAEGLRKPGSKLAHALQTLSESEVTLLRGKEGWRLSGALLVRNWFIHLEPVARARAGKRASLLLRLVQGETTDARLYDLFKEFLETLPERTEEEQDAAELLITLRMLSALGHDAGDIPNEEELRVMKNGNRRALIDRISSGITASGL